MQNRSVPVDRLLPHLVYEDVSAAVDWLSRAFGFVEHFRYGDPKRPDGAQMHHGDAWIMLATVRPGAATPHQLGGRTQSLTVFVDPVAAHFLHSTQAGVTIVEPLHETVYGDLQYAAEDLAGHLWIFSEHARDLSPEDWGATVAPPPLGSGGQV